MVNGFDSGGIHYSSLVIFLVCIQVKNPSYFSTYVVGWIYFSVSIIRGWKSI